MRILKTAIAAAALTAALAQPAAALEEHRFSDMQTKEGHTITQQGFWQLHPRGDGTVDVAFECYTNGAPFALLIGFKQCYLEGADGAKYPALTAGAHPGFVSATAEVVPEAPDQAHRICVQATAAWQDGLLDFTTTLACSSYQ